MQTISVNGLPLSLAIFIRAYTEALKLAPSRFLTLRVHPRTWDYLSAQAEMITHVVHQQEVTGPLGRRLLQVACVPAPKAIGEGITVSRDSEADPTKLEFQIHGITELVVKEILIPFALAEPERECPPKLLQ